MDTFIGDGKKSMIHDKRNTWSCWKSRCLKAQKSCDQAYINEKWMWSLWHTNLLCISQHIRTNWLDTQKGLKWYPRETSVLLRLFMALQNWTGFIDSHGNMESPTIIMKSCLTLGTGMFWNAAWWRYTQEFRAAISLTRMHREYCTSTKSISHELNIVELSNLLPF